MSEAGYRGPQVCKIVGITYRQLDYWARTELVRPSVCDAAGSGTQRLYSYRDLVELKVIKRLLDADISYAVFCLKKKKPTNGARLLPNTVGARRCRGALDSTRTAGPDRRRGRI